MTIDERTAIPSASASSPQPSALQPAGLSRRLGAMVYDGLLVIGVLAIATVPFIPLLHGRVLVAEEVGALAYVYRAWQLILLAAFFGFFWTRSGQTIGMLAWRLRVERLDGSLLRWPDALKRIGFLFALSVVPLAGYWLVAGGSSRTLRGIETVLAVVPVSLAYVSMLFDRERRAWHDRMTRTRVVVLPKGK
jgi:uncharacterized RDD family membrane protein YckC